MSEKCANCHRTIGSLETPFLFRESVVCAECNAKLTGTTPPAIASPVYVIHQTQGQQSQRLVAGLVAIFLGHLGIHKFILGYSGAGVAMLLISVLTCGVGWIVMAIIAVIEGIIYLSKSDADFIATYQVGRRSWF